MLKKVSLIIGLTLLTSTLFAAKLKIRLFDEQGNPVGEANAKLINSEAKKDWSKKASKKGELVFDGLPAGDYTFLAQKAGFLDRKMDGIKIEDADVDLDLKLVTKDTMVKAEAAGNEAFAKKDFKTALDNYEQILKYAPNSATTWSNVAKSHAMLSEWDLAIEAINKAANLDPAQFTDMAKQFEIMRHYQLGDKALNEKEFAVAETELTKAHELDPSNPDILYMLALCKGHMKKYTDAIKYCEEAIKLRPTDTASTELLKILKHNAELVKKP
jgi:tetratricopeptide (TPR) repeat protein